MPESIHSFNTHRNYATGKVARVVRVPTAKGVKKLDKDIEKQELFVAELQDFEEKLRRAANLDFGKDLDSSVVYEPDLNDGVILNIAPLWELVPWKEAKNYWDALLAGEYEWSAMSKLLRKKGL